MPDSFKEEQDLLTVGIPKLRRHFKIENAELIAASKDSCHVTHLITVNEGILLDDWRRVAERFNDRMHLSAGLLTVERPESIESDIADSKHRHRLRFPAVDKVHAAACESE